MHKNLFRVLAILLMGHFFLLIIFNNLPGILSSSLFWIPLWFVALIIFYPRQLFSKIYLEIYIYIFLSIIAFFTIWNNINPLEIREFYVEIGAIFTALSVYYYFLIAKDFKGLAYIVIFTIIFICISVITSIIGLIHFPNAARDLAGILGAEGKDAIIKKYESLGIGNYGFFAGLTFLPSILIMRLKILKDKRSIRKFIFFAICFIYIGLVFAQYFANIIIATFSIIIALSGKENFKKSLFWSSSILFILLIIPTDIYIKLMNYLANFLGNSVLSFKLKDFGRYLQYASARETTEAAHRTVRFPILFNYFLENPILGSEKGNIHLHWMNKLALYGLIGFIPFFIIIWKHIKINLRIIDKEMKFYYLLAVFSFLALGTIKSLNGREIFIIIFLIVPGINFLPYLTNTKNNFLDLKDKLSSY